MANQKSASKQMRPGLTPEAEENQCISLAYDAAKKQLLDGTASSQVITHFLKLGSTKERVELEKLKLEKELVAAKTQSLQDDRNKNQDYQEVLKALKKYNGYEEDDYEYDY